MLSVPARAKPQLGPITMSASSRAETKQSPIVLLAPAIGPPDSFALVWIVVPVGVEVREALRDM
jgi:hypothetical protein